MPVTLSSEVIGAVQPDKPEGFDCSDVVFYIVFVLLLVFAVIASKYLC